jgi:hypothetical protein
MKCDCGMTMKVLSFEGDWGWTEIGSYYCEECRTVVDE